MKRWGVACAVVVLTSASEVRAQDEVTTLETNLNQQTTELSTSDCVSACKALNSIRRAAERICTLAPGPRCDAAKAKADAATIKVREACPDCAVEQKPKQEDEQRARAPEPAAPSSTAEAASPPPGGCRSCATASGRPEYGDLAVFALAALVVTRRRKKDSRRL
jgi:hypothetical protein